MATFLSSRSASTRPQPAAAGLRLPPGIVQPFDLRILNDDLHVMVFFAGHPDYEAVEAMVSRTEQQGGWSVRAILTRHDQTQIDHVNDPEAVVARGAAPLEREVCHSEMEIESSFVEGLPRLSVAFISHRGERVVLTVQAAFAPNAQRGGVSDPGRHAADSSLPLMLRGRSSIAGPGTAVTIGGVAYPVSPWRYGAPSHQTWLHGFYTERHQLGLLRAGTRTLTLLEQPKVLAPGECWRYRLEGAAEPDWVYRIERRQGEQLDVMLGATRRVERFSVQLGDAGALFLRGVECAPAPEEEALQLSFPMPGRFALGIGPAQGLVTGQAESDGRQLRLKPEIPAWAVERSIDLRASRDGALWTLRCSIGSSSSV
ncbi:hypothetical protein [Variovorax terrae]|uniref:Uncharacterized protein n=1 Tax=Variovorax terrae TaxID=2923278 RepID=A0A9X2AQQ3_9BURK|nr:hypothetical protein [Variovorax terrae]MCJ0763446.1 hypothetical protein [Variovorax terrae]